MSITGIIGAIGGLLLLVIGTLLKMLSSARAGRAEEKKAKEEAQAREAAQAKVRVEDAGRFEEVIEDKDKVIVDLKKKDPPPDDIAELRRKLQNAGGVPLPENKK